MARDQVPGRGPNGHVPRPGPEPWLERPRPPTGSRAMARTAASADLVPGRGRTGHGRSTSDRSGHLPRDALDVRKRGLERHDVRVLRLDVEQVRLVRRLRAVTDALVRD